MKNKRKRNQLMVFLSLIGGLSLWVTAQSVTHMPASVKDPEAGWDWALKTADKKDVKKGFYIGYAIEHEENGRVCHRKNKYKGNKTLYEILYGREASKEQSHRLAKQVAILFRFFTHPGHRLDFQEIEISNLDQPVEIDMDNVPIFWLGIIQTDESIDHLKKCFKHTNSDKNRDTIVTAAGIHGPHPEVFGFLKKVLSSHETTKIRKNAAFWISLQQSPEAVKVLEHTVYNDPSSSVREHAVFGLYLAECKEANDTLVKLAKKGEDKHLRKKAIFWLGQKAAKRSAEILEDVVNDDADTDIQKAAVFALSQLPNGVPKLIKIASTHRSLKVRKQAIFWLSQSDDPRALDTILDIINK